MNRVAAQICARLSLRPPQARSLEILSEIADVFPLRKSTPSDVALGAVRGRYPDVESFERDFPSLCFALATGVGKTRLMAAFIAYLHESKGMRHFLVLAPNLTIYDKLIRDFTPNTPKYVFKGIGDFATLPPRLITGETYEHQAVATAMEGRKGQIQLLDESIHVNVFNISKLNREEGARIRKLSEYIGQSYFEYLSELDDLVMLMDESHRYRADAGMRTLNELRPVLGLELTATPRIQEGRLSTAFRNVIYSYPLGQAVSDGFVKEPAVATRKDFVAAAFSSEGDGVTALDKVKLEDGIRLHENVKVDLDVYSRETGDPMVKPFVLVIARDVSHATAVESFVKSQAFFGGRYDGKVITVHSGKSGTEKDEVVASLLNVEKPDNPIEIVIHIDMLKEGWDVTNLFTIVPLRKADSRILVEQSIGRGLRLPFGRRTGRKSVDRLTIIAHDRFAEIVAESEKPGWFLRGKIDLVEVPSVGQQGVHVPSAVDAALFGDSPEVVGAGGHVATWRQPTTAAAAGGSLLASEHEQALARVGLAFVKKAESRPTEYPRLENLGTSRARDSMAEYIREQAPPAQRVLPGFEEMVRRVTDTVTSTVVGKSIGIPRIVVIPTGEVTTRCEDFDLDASCIHLQPVDQAILLRHLGAAGGRDQVAIEDLATEATPEAYVLRALLDFDDVNYDVDGVLLNKLVGQAVARLRSYLPGTKEVFNVVMYHQRQLADVVHSQMQAHFKTTATAFEARVSQGFTMLSGASYTIPAGGLPLDPRAPVAKKSDVPSMIFGPWSRCLQPLLRFSSDPERAFAVIVDTTEGVEKWLRPGERDFHIIWQGSSRYEPDYLIETKDAKLLCEVKRAKDIDSREVKAKAAAAEAFCRNATAHEKQNGGKAWTYVLIPDDGIDAAQSLSGLVARWRIAGSGA
jgi:type III restriction enzyme